MKKQAWLLIIFAFLIAIPLTIQPINVSGAISSGGSDWPMFRHDLSHSGFTNGSVTGSVNLFWVFSTGGFVRSSPAVVNGSIFFGSWDGFFYCLDANSGGLLWKYPIREVIATSPAVDSGRVCFGADDGYVYSMNAITGELLWRTQIGGRVRSSPTIADGYLYIGSGDHDLYALNATDGSVIWVFNTSRVISAPAVSNGTIYFSADDYNVYALNAFTGQKIWQTHTGAVGSAPSVYEGYVYVGSADGYICSLNASTGVLAWQYLTQDGVSASPAVAYGYVYVGSEDNSFYCLNASSGKLVWSAPTGFWVRSSAVVYGGNLYVGSFDNNLYCINAFTGAKEWNFTTGDYVWSSPSIVGGVLYVGSDDYHVYAFNLKGPPSETLHQFFMDTLSWTTIAFDAIAIAFIAFIVFVVARHVRSSWRNQPERTGKSVTYSWLLAHHDLVFVLILLGLSTVFFINLGSGHMWAADEQTYSQWAYHMMKSGDYLNPWADGFLSFYVSKPPLNMWMMSLAYQVFGVTNFASRLSAAVLGTFSLVVVFFLGKKLYNSYIGFLSAIVLGTFSTFYVFARHAMTDVPFLFFAVCSIYFLILSEKSEKTTRYAALSGVFFGAAFMIKQVEALLIPLILIIYLAVTSRNVKFLFTKRFTLFWGIGLLVFSPWLIYMTLSYGSPFLEGYFGYSTITRIMTPVEGHSAGYLYYFTYLAQNENILWVILLPFSAVICGFRAIFKRSNADTLIVVWMTIVLLFFTFAQTRIYWYILPAFPAFAIAIGSLLFNILNRFRRGLNALSNKESPNSQRI